MKSVLICAVLVAGSVTFAADPASQSSSSPSAATSVSFGDRNLTVKYSAPSMRGRKIFGGLVPFGQVWCAGENAAVVFHTDADLVVRDMALPKGDYTLYVLVDAKQWQLVISKQKDPGQKYDEKADYGRIPMDMSNSRTPIETYKVTLANTTEREGRLQLEWENTIASVPFKIDVVPGDPDW